MEAQVTMVDREAALDQVYEMIEKNLMVSSKNAAFLDRMLCSPTSFQRFPLFHWLTECIQR